MFLPFLPIILAALSLSLLALETHRSPPLLGWSPLQLLALLMLGSFMLGQLRILRFKRGPLKKLIKPGTGPSAKITLPRLLALTLWLGIIYGDAVDVRLRQAWISLPHAEPISITLLIMVYWVADALSAIPARKWNVHGLREKMQGSASHLRIQLPILLLGILQSIWLIIMRSVPWPLDLNMEGTFEMISSLMLMLLLAPMILVKSWGALPLPAAQSTSLIEQELSANGVPVRAILCWPESILPHSTAGVIGFLPGCRYLVISRRLIKVLTNRELQSVVAHEAGHLVKWHLLFFAAGFFIFLELSTIALSGFSLLENLELLTLPPGWELPAMILGILLFFRFGIGFLSRNFERQADCHSFSRTGLLPFANALLKVGWINGINPEQTNWHHWGIRERIDFLTRCNSDQDLLPAHHLRVKKIKLGCLVILFTLMGMNAYLVSDASQIHLLTWNLERHSKKWTQEDRPAMTRLADLLYFDKQLQLSEWWYREALRLAPDDPHTLNNLAWLLTEFHEGDPQRLDESVLLAEKALAHRKAAFIWDTLAEAYWKTDASDSALRAAEQALKMAERGVGLTRENDLSYYRERLLTFKNKMDL